jgi:multidrug efflux pump subunit AcrA (membrane-fusion protein)
MSLNFGGNKKDDADSKVEVFVPTLQATEVKNAEENFSVFGYGTVSSFNAVDISCEVQGKLIQGKTLKPGVKFKQGDLLFKVNDAEARYNIRSRKSGFINIIAQLLPDIKVDFSSEYVKWENYVASIKLNEALPQLPAWKSSKEKIFLSTRNVLTEYFAIKSQEEQLKKFYVRAPYTGVITETFIANHAVVNPGTKVVRIAQTENFEIPVSVPASSISSIEIGTKGEIYTTTGELKGVGVVVRISEVINKSTQSIDVYVKPEALEGKTFIEGEYVKVAISGSGTYNGTRLPLNAVKNNEVFIYTKEDSTLQKQEVLVLDENENGVFVSGLNNKDIVITQEVLNNTDTSKYEVLLK